MKKSITLLLSLMMVVSLVSGCGASPTSSPAPAPDVATPAAPAPSADPTPAKLEGEITFWHSFTQGPRLESIQKAADGFMAENPGVKIKIETFSWADFYTKWTTGLASGNVPDMSSATPAQVVEMIDVDAILPMDDLIDSIGRDRFYEKALVEMKNDGKCYAVPLYSNTEALWLRTDLMEKYNLAVPETWDELYEASVKINEGEKGQVYGCTMPMGTNDMLSTRWLHLYMRSAGDNLITPEGKANLTSKTAIDGINYWVKMYKTVSPPDAMNYNTLDQATMYYQGKLAFDFNTGFHIGGVQTNSPDILQYVDCAPIPRVNKGDPPIGCETNNTPMVVWKNSKNPEICKAFIEYFYDPARYVDFLLSVPVGMMPALKGVTEDPKYLANPIVQQFGHAQEVLNEMLSGSTAIGMEYGPTAKAGLLTSQRVIENMFQEIVLKNTPVEEAAKAAEKKLNELFETVE